MFLSFNKRKLILFSSPGVPVRMNKYNPVNVILEWMEVFNF